MDSHDIIQLIATSPRRTPAKAFIAGRKLPKSEKLHCYGNDDCFILIGQVNEIREYLENNKENIYYYDLEVVSRNQALPLLDISTLNARIEPGSIIRSGVEIGDQAVIMMGAIINIGAKIGAKSMIDMNAVIGGRAIIGQNCHIGAGAVIAGVIEPPSKQPVIIGDNVLVGANATILEGLNIGTGAIIGAGAVVTKSVPPNWVMAGVPAKKIGERTMIDNEKIKIVEELRDL